MKVISCLTQLNLSSAEVLRHPTESSVFISFKKWLSHDSTRFFFSQQNIMSNRLLTSEQNTYRWRTATWVIRGNCIPVFGNTRLCVYIWVSRAQAHKPSLVPGFQSVEKEENLVFWNMATWPNFLWNVCHFVHISLGQACLFVYLFVCLSVCLFSAFRTPWHTFSHTLIILNSRCASHCRENEMFVDSWIFY